MILLFCSTSQVIEAGPDTCKCQATFYWKIFEVFFENFGCFWIFLIFLDTFRIFVWIVLGGKLEFLQQENSHATQSAKNSNISELDLSSNYVGK